MGLARYERQVKLGEWPYGVVDKALDTVTGGTVALKILKFDEFDEGGRASTLLPEISILKTTNQINIIALIDVCTATIPADVAFEYVESDLARMIAHRGRPLKPL
jgi:serine/threonine protein kinase